MRTGLTGGRLDKQVTDGNGKKKKNGRQPRQQQTACDCLFVPSPRHTHLFLPLSKHKEKEQSQTSTLISISQTSHARVTNTHTIKADKGRFIPDQFWLLASSTFLRHMGTFCLDSHHIHIKRTHTAFLLPANMLSSSHCCYSQPFYNPLKYTTALITRASGGP